MRTLRRLFALAVFAAIAAGAWLFVFGAGAGEPVRYTPRVAKTPRLRGVMSPTRDMTEEDLDVLAGWNVTLIRFQIMRNWLQLNTDRDLPEYDWWFDARLNNLERLDAAAYTGTLFTGAAPARRKL